MKKNRPTTKDLIAKGYPTEEDRYNKKMMFPKRMYNSHLSIYLSIYYIIIIIIIINYYYGNMQAQHTQRR